MGDRFPTYRLENHTNSRMFYGQVGFHAQACFVLVLFSPMLAARTLRLNPLRIHIRREIPTALWQSIGLLRCIHSSHKSKTSLPPDNRSSMGRIARRRATRRQVPSQDSYSIIRV